MWMLLFVTLRFFEITNGVVTSELRIDDVFQGAIANLTPPATSALVDVTNHPEYVIGCSYSRAVVNGTRSIAGVTDTCPAPPAPKLILRTQLASSLTALEWTAMQTKIAAGDTVTAGALDVLLNSVTTATGTAAINTLVAQGVLTPARGATLTAALAASAL